MFDKRRKCQTIFEHSLTMQQPFLDLLLYLETLTLNPKGVVAVVVACRGVVLLYAAELDCNRAWR